MTGATGHFYAKQRMFLPGSEGPGRGYAGDLRDDRLSVRPSSR